MNFGTDTTVSASVPADLGVSTRRLTDLQFRLGLDSSTLDEELRLAGQEDEADRGDPATRIALLLRHGWSEADLRKSFCDAYSEPFGLEDSVFAVVTGKEPRSTLPEVAVMVNAAPWLAQQAAATVQDLILNAEGHTEQGKRGSGQNRRMLRLGPGDREAFFNIYAEIDQAVTQLALLTFPAVPWQIDVDAGELLRFIRARADRPSSTGYAALSALFSGLDLGIVRHRALQTRLRSRAQG